MEPEPYKHSMTLEECEGLMLEYTTHPQGANNYPYDITVADLSNAVNSWYSAIYPKVFRLPNGQEVVTVEEDLKNYIALSYGRYAPQWLRVIAALIREERYAKVLRSKTQKDTAIEIATSFLTEAQVPPTTGPDEACFDTLDIDKAAHCLANLLSDDHRRVRAFAEPSTLLMNAVARDKMSANYGKLVFDPAWTLEDRVKLCLMKSSITRQPAQLMRDLTILLKSDFGAYLDALPAWLSEIIKRGQSGVEAHETDGARLTRLFNGSPYRMNVLQPEHVTPALLILQNLEVVYPGILSPGFVMPPLSDEDQQRLQEMKD